jgi:hypothetical protein
VATENTIVEYPIITDDTGRAIAGALQAMAHDKVAALKTNWDGLARMSRDGLAPYVLGIGDQITSQWTDPDGGTAYDVANDVCHFPAELELQDGEKLPGTILQWHYTLPFGTQFDQKEAFWYCEAALAAGTYNLTMGASWGTNVVKGKTYQFTLAKDVPKGGVLAGMEYAPDRDPGTWQVKSYKTVSDADSIETVGMSEGAQGTSLGTIGTKPDGNMNSIYRCAYGYNRWSQSALRQYLNGKGTNWWKPQNKWDRPPEYVGKHGFLDGIPEAELAVMRRVKVVTGVPYCEEGTDSEPVLDTTYDLVFLPSLEEHFLALGESGMKGKEGEAWEYWARVAQSPTPLALWQTWPQLITYAINGKTSPQSVWTRSAYRNSGGYTFIVGTSGTVYDRSARYALRCAPARAI